MRFEMPSVQEWNEIEANYPAAILQVNGDDFDFVLNQESFERFADAGSLMAWINFLSNRLIQTRWSYVIMMFHFKKGIPDEKWKISPGRQGESVQYFPDYKDYVVRKAQFDYFADVFYFKLYSSLDTVGHLLHMVYDLKVNKPDFHKSVEKLRFIRPELHAKLKSIEGSEDFQNLRSLRHGVTHNELPGHVGGTITRVTPNYFTIGAGSYTPSVQIVEIAKKSVEVLVQVLTVIREQISQDRVQGENLSP